MIVIVESDSILNLIVQIATVVGVVVAATAACIILFSAWGGRLRLILTVPTTYLAIWCYVHVPDDPGCPVYPGDWIAKLFCVAVFASLTCWLCYTWSKAMSDCK